MADLVRLEKLLQELAVYNIDQVVSQLSLSRTFPVGVSPLYWREQSKAYNIAWLLKWAQRHPQHAPKLVAVLEEAAESRWQTKQKATVGPGEGYRYVTWQEFESLPSYSLIASAVSYPYTHTKVADPETKDGYVAVAAIYNISAWASWKSSSLDRAEQERARAIQAMPWGELMRINEGRRSNQPALFPTGFKLVVRSSRLPNPTPETITIEGIKYIVHLSKTASDYRRESKPNLAAGLERYKHRRHLYVMRPKGLRIYFTVQYHTGEYSSPIPM